MTPFRNEKNSNWEGAYRVPAMVRWPGKIKPGTVSNEHRLASRLDADAARRRRCPDVKEKLLDGLQGRRHDLQGASRRLQPRALSHRPGEPKSPRKEFFYFSDDGDLTALRYDNWKFVFLEQRAHGHPAGLGRAFHAPCGCRKIFNLRTRSL